MASLPVSEIFVHPDGRTRLAVHVWRTDETRQYFLSFDRRLAAGTGRSARTPRLRLELPAAQWACALRRRRRGARAGGRRARGDPGGHSARGSVHRARQEAELYVTMEPGREFAYRFARTFGRALAAGAVNEQHELPWLHLMVVLRASRAQTYAVGPPRLIQKHIAIPLAAWIGRRVFGYQVVWQ